MRRRVFSPNEKHGIDFPKSLLDNPVFFLFFMDSVWFERPGNRGEDMKRAFKDQKGLVIVEAAIVFPVMFFAILMMLFMGNVYYQQAKINSVVDVAAVKGAAHFADPMLDDIEKNGSVPTRYNDIQPYRYLFGMYDLQSNIQEDVKSQIESIGSGFFKSMAPRGVNVNAKFNNHLLLFSFTVEATYEIKVPFRFMGTEPPKLLSMSAKATAPVSDNGEFINNIDMALDYYESSGAKRLVDNATGKIKEFFNKIGK